MRPSKRANTIRPVDRHRALGHPRPRSPPCRPPTRWAGWAIGSCIGWRSKKLSAAGRPAQASAPYSVVQTTGEGKTVDEVDWVEITDPTHRLYGFRLPLVRTLTHPQRGRLCVVRLYPGLDCYVPLAATSLVDKVRSPS